MCLVYIRGPVPLTFCPEVKSFLSDLILYILSNSFILKKLGYLFSNRPIDLLIFVFLMSSMSLYLYTFYWKLTRSWSCSMFLFRFFIYMQANNWMEIHLIAAYINLPHFIQFTSGLEFEWKCMEFQYL